MPLVAETLLLCAIAYLIGIGLAALLLRRLRRRGRPFLEE
jgi:hypothetical protein